MKSHDRHGVSNHRQLDCLLRPTLKKISMSRISDPLWVKSIGDYWGPIRRGAFPCHDIIMKDETTKSFQGYILVRLWCHIRESVSTFLTPLCGESTGHRMLFLIKVSKVQTWCYLLCWLNKLLNIQWSCTIICFIHICLYIHHFFRLMVKAMMILNATVSI